MISRPDRRSALFLLAGAAVPMVARAEVPPATAPAVPSFNPPVPAPAAPIPSLPAPATTIARPAPAAPAAAIDKTKSYYLFFDQNIDVASMRTLRRQLTNLVEAGVTEITLVLDSPGGLVEPMLVTYSFILALPAKINTHAAGFIQSAATILYLAGQERSADRSARFVFHPSQSQVIGVMNEDQVRERMTGFDTIGDVMTQIYHDRTTLPVAEIDHFTHGLVVYTAEQARTFGIVHTVADLRIPAREKAKIMFLD